MNTDEIYSGGLNIDDSVVGSPSGGRHGEDSGNDDEVVRPEIGTPSLDSESEFRVTASNGANGTSKGEGKTEGRGGSAGYSLFRDAMKRQGTSYVRRRDISETQEKGVFRHGEIFFEETNLVAKFLVVPEHVMDPLDILQVMLDDGPTGWGMAKPRMTISIESGAGNYFALPTGWEHWPTDWGAYPESAADSFHVKIGDVVYGICCAAAECDAWITSTASHRVGGIYTGALIDEGVKKLRSPVTNLAMGTLDGVFDVTPGQREEIERTSASGCDPELIELFKKTFRMPKDEWHDYAVPLGTPVTQQWVYPAVPRQYHPPLYLADKDKAATFGNMWCLTIRPFVTHIIFAENEKLLHVLKHMTEDVAPHVRVICSGKNRNTLKKALYIASGGGQIILLKSSGYWVNRIIKAVSEEGAARKKCQSDVGLSEVREEGSGEEKGRGTVVVNVRDVRQQKDCPLHLPDSASLRNFIVLDAIKDSAERVIEKLIKALTSVGGTEMRETGFQETELQRLRYAWELYVLYEYNAYLQALRARSFFYVLTLVAFCTTTFAVTLTAGEMIPTTGDLIGIDGSFRLDSGWKSVLKVTVAVLPLVSAFLLSLNGKFAPIKKWATLTAASERVKSEIYRYRARVGVYEKKMKNERLNKLMAECAERAPVIGKKDGKRAGRGGKAAKGHASGKHLSARERFAATLTELQTELLSGEISMGALMKAPPWKFRKLRSAFFDPDNFASKTPVVTGGSTRRVAPVSTVTPLVSLASMKTMVAGIGEDIRSTRLTSTLFTQGDKHAPSDFNLLASATSDDVIADDGVGLVSAEDYMLFRLRPAVHHFSRMAPGLEKIFNYIQFFLLFATLSASVLGLINLRAWIPVAVAFVSVMDAVLQFEQTSSRLLGTNNALTHLKNLRLWWQSLSMVERRMLGNKTYLVESAEDAIESATTAWTQGMISRRKTAVKADEGEESEEET
eukprot:GEMP01004837.1.p1 GENE.GEMP01004837.1~~GEMP01004837.1.p1  ORF type:complete len:961 (-),score=203.55 GEMP01004837.1:905-3787(-)